jgi:hypothetical protein
MPSFAGALPPLVQWGRDAEDTETTGTVGVRVTGEACIEFLRSLVFRDLNRIEASPSPFQVDLLRLAQYGKSAQTGQAWIAPKVAEKKQNRSFAPGRLPRLQFLFLDRSIVPERSVLPAAAIRVSSGVIP